LKRFRSKSDRPIVIGVIGASVCRTEVRKKAERVGKAIASKGAVLVCGGLGGVMSATCKGAARAGGTTIGILPGRNPSSANDYVTYAVATGMGEARNAIIVNTADAIVAVSGGYGTLSELAFALRAGVPVAGIGTWQLDESIAVIDDPEAAVEWAYNRAVARRGGK
jgi:uncharacterized protein (TIGR00725 family)